jgi:hypothetical protein
MEGKALLIGRAAVVGTGIEELNQRLDRLRRISREDLNRAALKYLDPEHALTVTVPGAGLLGNLSRLIFGVKKLEEDIVPAPAPETVLRGRPGVTRPSDMAEKAPVREGKNSVGTVILTAVVPLDVATTTEEIKKNTEQWYQILAKRNALPLCRHRRHLPRRVLP